MSCLHKKCKWNADIQYLWNKLLHCGARLKERDLRIYLILSYKHHVVWNRGFPRAVSATPVADLSIKYLLNLPRHFLQQRFAWIFLFVAEILFLGKDNKNN